MSGTSGRKLRYLLVMPRLVLSLGDGYSFPLGLPYISASMKTAGFDVRTLNLNHREGDVQDIIKKEVLGQDIDVVATGGLSFQYNTIRKVVESAKAARKDVRTIVGGGIITSDPTTAMEALEAADMGVIGEGELAIVELCRTLETGSDLSTVDGIILRENAGYKVTGPRKEITNIDTIAWPDYEGFELEKYLAGSPGISGLNTKNTIFMIASRSCPYNCTFCFHTVGRHYRQRTLDNFFAELDYMVSRYRVDYVCLADELFSMKFERVKEFCARMKKYGIRWWAQFRVDNITPEMLPLLKESGCDVMSFGLESADNRVLKSMQKHTTVEQIEKSLKLVYDAGISMEGAFIFGDIAETWETAQNTLGWWRKHTEYKISLNLITVYPGSLLYEHACREGIITDRVKYLRDGCPQVNISQLTDAQYSELIRTLMEAPITLTRSISVEVHAADYRKGRIDVSGLCAACGQSNSWENIKIFTTNFLACKRCGQKYHMSLPLSLRTNIERNMERILSAVGKVAVWGINYHTADLFKQSEALKQPGIYAVDISSTKKMLDLYGKQVFRPEIISSEGISTVVIAIPIYFSQIEGQIRASLPSVRSIIDLCHLTDPSFAPPAR